MRRPLVLLLLVAVAVLGGSSALSGTSGKGGSQRARLVRVVDGDTLLVRTDGRRERVRLIGIDTPESVAPDRPDECGGEEASKALRRRAPEGSDLKLVFEQGEFATERRLQPHDDGWSDTLDRLAHAMSESRG